MTPKEELCSFIGILKSAQEHDYDEIFYNIIGKAKELLKLDNKDLVELFDISYPTLARWLNGENCPHPNMRPVVYRTLAEIAKHIVEEHDGEA